MSIVRWEPLGEMDSLFNRLMPSMFGRWPGRFGTIRAELPAVKKEDVKVTVDDGMITIEGERKQQKEDKNEKLHRIESFYGHFTRSFSLPETVKESAIRCESKDGVLTVHIPKAESPKQQPKQIKVE